MLELTSFIIAQNNGESDGDFQNNGIAHWLLGQQETGISMWQRGQKSKYSDVAGGIESLCLLYFASVVRKDESLKKTVEKGIRKLIKRKASVNWPAPLGRFLLNDIEDGELLSLCSSTPILKERQLCQACFVVAVRSLEHEKMADFVKHLGSSVTYGAYSSLENEFYLSRGLLDSIEGYLIQFPDSDKERAISHSPITIQRLDFC